MTEIITIGNGLEITVTADSRVPTIKLAVWANRGSTGLVLDRRQAIKLRTALLAAILEAEKSTTQPKG